MHALMKLKEIAEKQKTVSTSRLAPLLKEVETMYIQQGNRIRNQRKKLKYYEEKTKAGRKK